MNYEYKLPIEHSIIHVIPEYIYTAYFYIYTSYFSFNVLHFLQRTLSHGNFSMNIKSVSTVCLLNSSPLCGATCSFQLYSFDTRHHHYAM